MGPGRSLPQGLGGRGLSPLRAAGDVGLMSWEIFESAGFVLGSESFCGPEECCNARKIPINILLTVN